MRSSTTIRSLVVTLLTALITGPVWAVFNQTVVLTGENVQAIQGSSLSFTTSDGTPVEVKESDEDGEFILVFSGDSGQAGTATVAGKDGSAIDIAIPVAGKGENIVINVDTRTAVVVPSTGDRVEDSDREPGPSPGKFIEIGTGWQVFEMLPNNAAAVEKHGGFETNPVVTDDEIIGDFVNVAVGIPTSVLGGMHLTIYGSQGDGDDLRAGHLAPGGNEKGFVFWDFMPVDGFTGFLLGAPFGVYGQIHSAYEDDQFGVSGSWSTPMDNGWSRTWSIDLSSRSIDQRHISMSSTQGFEQFVHVNGDARIEQDYTNVDVGVTFNKDLNNITLSIGGGIGIQSTDADLNGTQDVLCVGCFEAGDSFQISVSDRISETSFGAHAQVSASYSFGNFEVGAFARIERLGDQARLVTTQTGDDLFVRNMPTHLVSDDVTFTSKGLYGRIRF